MVLVGRGCVTHYLTPTSVCVALCIVTHYQSNIWIIFNSASVTIDFSIISCCRRFSVAFEVFLGVPWMDLCGVRSDPLLWY